MVQEQVEFSRMLSSFSSILLSITVSKELSLTPSTSPALLISLFNPVFTGPRLFFNYALKFHLWSLCYRSHASLFHFLEYSPQSPRAREILFGKKIHSTVNNRFFYFFSAIVARTQSCHLLDTQRVKYIFQLPLL